MLNSSGGSACSDSVSVKRPWTLDLDLQNLQTLVPVTRSRLRQSFWRLRSCLLQRCQVHMLATQGCNQSEHGRVEGKRKESDRRGTSTSSPIMQSILSGSVVAILMPSCLYPRFLNSETQNERPASYSSSRPLLPASKLKPRFEEDGHHKSDEQQNFTARHTMYV